MKKDWDRKKNIVGKQIRAARLLEKPHVTQREISARLETYGVYLSDSAIGKIENGTRPVTDIQIAAFAKSLKTTVSFLFGENVL